MITDKDDLDWLERVYQKANSHKSKTTAKASLTAFETYCRSLNKTKSEVISELKRLYDSPKDKDLVYRNIDRFVQFLNRDHPEINYVNCNGKTSHFKKKSPKTISVYLGFVVNYLRIVHRIRLIRDDLKDFVQLPRQIKEPRKPITIETVKLLIDHAGPRERALYLVLISSGMRIGEALALRKQDIHIDEDPVRVEIRAETTKTREGRDTYISAEATEKVIRILENKEYDDFVFTDTDNEDIALKRAEQNFDRLRQKLHLTKRYPNSIRYIVTLHAFRAYFHTKASQTHGSDYANALDGHSGYLKQYYRMTDEERAQKYKELEPQLLVESTNPKITSAKDKQMQSMRLEMEKMKEQIKRLQDSNK